MKKNILINGKVYERVTDSKDKRVTPYIKEMLKMGFPVYLKKEVVKGVRKKEVVKGVKK
jgi:predicted peroxiredoxin